MESLRHSLEAAPVVERDGYNYFIHPLTDGIPKLDPSLLRDVVIEIIKATDIDEVEYIITPAAMGIHLSTALALTVDLPLLVIRKRSYGLDEEVAIEQTTGYGESTMYVNDVEAGDNVLVIDDVVSTGGTLSAILSALDDIGAEVVDTIAVVQKGDLPAHLEAKDVTTLATVDIIEGAVQVRDG